MDDNFATPESIFTVPNYRVKNFEKMLKFIIRKKKLKNHENITSGKLKSPEKSYAAARFATPRVLWQLPLKGEEFQNLKKKIKLSYLENDKDLSSHCWRQD